MARFHEYDKVGKEFNIGGQDWFKFKPGENKVRLVSEFQEYATHFLKDSKENVTCEGEDCLYCQKDDKARIQFIGWILDRADNQFKLASIGWSVFKQIGEYATSKDWGFTTDMPPYDLIVKKTGEGLGTEYTVMPSRNEEALTKEEEDKLKELKSPKEIVSKMKDKHPGERLAKTNVEDKDIPVHQDTDPISDDEVDLF